MGVRQAVDFRFPEREASYTQGGNHLHSADDTWQTAQDFLGKRGTMYLRHTTTNANWLTELKVTIDGNLAIQDGSKATRNGAHWIFDFNQSVKIEHKCLVGGYSTVCWAYYEYKP